MVEVTQAERYAAILELGKLCHEGGIAEGRRQMREEAADIAGAIDSGRGNEAEIAKAIRAIPIGDE